MTDEDFRKLKEGDVIRNNGSGRGDGYMVVANYGEWKVVSRTLTATNPAEWDLASKANREREA